MSLSASEPTFDPSVPEPRPADAQLVTVAVPARNEEAWIGRCLDAILAQDHAYLDVVVVDSASTDRTAEIVEAYADRDPRVRIVPNPTATIPSALNLALAAARSSWFVRVDAHSTIPPDYVRRAVAHLTTGRWGGVGGRKDGVGETATGRAIAAALGSPFGVGDSVYHHGTRTQLVDHVPFGAYPTAVLREIGGWDERLEVNEDFELDLRLRRAGHRLLFDPELRIAWGSRQTIAALFGQYRRYGKGKADVARLHPDSLALRHLAAPGLVAAVAGGLVLLPRNRRPLLWLLVLYGAASAAAVARAATKERDRRVLARMPAAFAAMHAGWGIGFWQGVLTRRSSRPGRPA